VKGTKEVKKELGKFPDQDNRALNWVNRISNSVLLIFLAIGEAGWIGRLAFWMMFLVFVFLGFLQVRTLYRFRTLCLLRDPGRINLFCNRNPLACWRWFLGLYLMPAIHDALDAGIKLEEEAERHLANICLNPFYRTESRRSRYFLTLPDSEIETLLEYLAEQELSDRTVACLRAEKQRFQNHRFFDQIVGNESFLNS
jgi:hypothetical protein